jgi:hypothetical protein
MYSSFYAGQTYRSALTILYLNTNEYTWKPGYFLSIFLTSPKREQDYPVITSTAFSSNSGVSA